MPNPSSNRWVVLGPFLTAVLMLCVMGAVVVDAMSTVRAYVSGESLYSKGQKDAVYHLWRYAWSKREDDFARYRASIALPLGDRLAREELDRPEPDLARVRAGFLQGGNHPDDVDGLIRLYRRFHGVPFMARAIQTWTEGDLGIAELDRLAQRLHAVVSGGAAETPAMAALMAELPVLNDRLTTLEQRFSATLGEGSRTVQAAAVGATFFLGLVLMVAGGLLTSKMLRRQAAAERALRESNDRWQLAAAAAGIGVFDWNMARGAVALDSRAAAMCGLAPGRSDNVEISRISALIHPEDRPGLCRAVQEATAAEAALELRYRMQGSEGREWHLEVAGKIEAAADGHGKRMVGILWDVTADVQREQLRLDKETAERASAAKSVFLSRVSHELRTPLNAVLGFAQLLEQDPVDPLTPPQLQRIRYVLDSGNHLLALIDDVLDLTSMDQDAAPRDLVGIDLAEALRASLMQVEPMAQSHDVAIHPALPETGLTVRGDPKWMRQVFINLLSNAIKYNRRGGRVEVKVEVGHGSEHVEVSVLDTGIGMTPEQVAALFQPFNRLGAERSKVPGSGLGLVIVRQLLDRMDATLEVGSEHGSGSVFKTRFRRAG